MSLDEESYDLRRTRREQSALRDTGIQSTKSAEEDEDVLTKKRREISNGNEVSGTEFRRVFRYSTYHTERNTRSRR